MVAVHGAGLGSPECLRVESCGVREALHQLDLEHVQSPVGLLCNGEEVAQTSVQSSWCTHGEKEGEEYIRCCHAYTIIPKGHSNQNSHLQYQNNHAFEL